MGELRENRDQLEERRVSRNLGGKGGGGVAESTREKPLRNEFREPGG